MRIALYSCCPGHEILCSHFSVTLPGGLVLPPRLLSHLHLLLIFLLRVITIISICVSIIVASPSNDSLVPSRVYSKFVSVHLDY